MASRVTLSQLWSGGVNRGTVISRGPIVTLLVLLLVKCEDGDSPGVALLVKGDSRGVVAHGLAV